MLVVAIPLFGFFAADPGYPPDTVVVEVVDAAGAPVSTAEIYVPWEADRHRVNTTTGRWGTAFLYGAGGLERAVDRGDHLDVLVLAPGYWPTQASVLAAGTRDPQQVVLEALPPQPEAHFDHLPADLARLGDENEAAPHLALTYAAHIAEHGPTYLDDSLRWTDRAIDDARSLHGDALVEHLLAAHQIRAIAANEAWREAALADLDGTDPDGEAHARRLAEVTARDWIEASRVTGRSTPLGVALCESAAPRPERCGD